MPSRLMSSQHNVPVANQSLPRVPAALHHNPFSRSSSRDRVGSPASCSPGPSPSSTTRPSKSPTESHLYGSENPPTYLGPPPSYSYTPPPIKEPRTIPMYLFFLGFVCPILWLIGTFRMRMPHQDRTGAFDPYMRLSGAEKAAAQHEAEERHRKWIVEMKWAKRCMWASVVFVCLGLAVGMSVWGALASRNKSGKGALAP